MSGWSEDDIETMTRMWADGYTGTQIGTKVHRSRSAVLGMVHRLRLPPRVNPQRKEISRSLEKRTRRVRRAALRIVTAPQKAAPFQSDPPKLPEARMVSLMALEENACRFPMGDPKQPGFGFCGVEKRWGSSYCEFHHRLCWEPADDRRERRLMGAAKRAAA